MKLLITGGSGDLGTLLIPDLVTTGYEPINLDIQAPRIKGGEYIQASITEREALKKAMQDIDMVLHIAAWHGIHHVKAEVSTEQFWDVNVTGTFNVFEAAAQANVKSVIYISSTSVDEPYDVYGHTKVLGEKIAETYHYRHGMQVVSLRPRAFIPHWNSYAYENFIEWARWFWGGAVHINDVKQAVRLCIDAMAQQQLPDYLALNLDSTYEYSKTDLDNWDADGAGSTFRKYYAEYEALAVSYGLDITQKPSVKDIADTVKHLGYSPQYSLRTLLEELAEFGEAGSPRPF